MTKLKYQRILLKLSGESLLGNQKQGIDFKSVDRVRTAVGELIKLGVQVAIVIGGGNIFRGRDLTKTGLDQITADHMGMLATVMNGLALRDAFFDAKIPVRLMSAIAIAGFVDAYDRRKAMHYLEHNQVVIFVGGTGLPLFTTDSAAALRSIEIKADVILKATTVDAVYSADPKKDKHAKRFKQLTYQEVLDQQLGIMDLSALCVCQEHHMPIRVFDMNAKNILTAIITGGDEGTVITN